MAENILVRAGVAGLCTVLTLTATSALALVPVPSGISGHTPLLVNIAYSSTVAGIQTELKKAGYDAGPVDGLMGNRTRAAIRAYQQDKGLLVTGQASQTLLQHIVQSNSGRNGSTGPDDNSDRREQRVERLQQMLSRLGYSVTATGTVDARTRAAIRAYQRDHGLNVTGKPDRSLFRQIRQQLRTGKQDGSSPSRATVSDIQRGLKARGYDVGEVDGRMSPRTREAIRSYQQARGVPVTGEASAALVGMLREGLNGRQSRETIRAVQQALNAKGYDAGPEDGVLGPSTRSAIRGYKEANGIPSNATVSTKLLTSLGISNDSDGVSSPEARYRTRISDNFNDGNFTAGPSWQVLSQNFTVEDGKLKSDVDNRVSDEEIGEKFLRGILGQTLGVALPGGSNAAAIVQNSPFGNAFQISMVISGSPEGSSRINMGPYLGNSVTRGYRLVYDSAKSEPLSLLAVGESGTRTIASTSQVARLGNKEFYQLKWTRNPQGEMAVLVDGQLSLAVRDRSIEDGFSGFSMINAGGEWQVDEITVRSTE